MLSHEEFITKSDSPKVYSVFLFVSINVDESLFLNVQIKLVFHDVFIFILSADKKSTNHHALDATIMSHFDKNFQFI